MRVLQLGGQLDLAAEPLDVDRGGEIRGQHLHHDLPPKCHLLREIDAAHAAAAQLAEDPVGAPSAPWSSCCRLVIGVPVRR